MIDPMNDLRNKLGELMLPTKEFNEEFQRHVKLCKLCVETGKIKSLAPRVVLVCAEEGKERVTVLIGLGGMPDTNDEKRALFGKLGLVAASNDLKVVMAIFQSEAWTVRCDKEGDWEKMPRPSDHPDRVEVIVNVARSLDERNAMATIPITGRDADGALVLGEPDVQIEEGDGEKEVKDSLLSSFFLTFLTGMAVKLAAEEARKSGESIPAEAEAMLELMRNCPFKLQRADEFLAQAGKREEEEEEEESAEERDRKLDDDCGDSGVDTGV